MVKDNINLTEYILERVLSKDDTYDKETIDILIEEIRSKSIDLMQIVDELPTEDIEPNRLYLIYNKSPHNNNLFDTFIYVDGEWEQLDGLDFNVHDYYTSNQLDALLYAKASREDLNSTRATLTTVRDNLTTLYENLTDFNEALIDFDDDNTNLSTDLDKLRENLSGFITRVNTLIDTLDTLQSDMSSVQSDISNTQSDLEGLSKDLNGDNTTNPPVKGLKTELSETQTSLETTRGSLDLAKLDIINLGIASENLSSQLSDLDDDLDDALDRITDTETDINTLQGTTTTLTGQVSDLTSGLQTTNTSLTSTSNSLQSLRTDVYGDNNANPPIKGLQGELNDAKTSLTSATNSISSLTSATQQLTTDLTRVDNGLSTTNTSLQTTNTTLNALNTQINGDPNNNNDNGLTGDLETLQTSLFGDGTQGSGLVSNIATLSGNVANMMNVLSDGEGGWIDVETSIVQFDEQLDSFINDLALLGTSLADFEGDLSDFIAENPNLQLTTFSLNSSVTELFVNIGKVRSDVSELQVDINGDANTTGLKENLQDIQTELYGDENDATDNGLLGLMTEVTTTTIPNVQNSISTVNNTVYGTGGSANDVKNDSLITHLQNTTTLANTTSQGLTNSISRIADTESDITNLQTNLYGNGNDTNGDPYSFSNPSANSYIDKLNTTSDDLATAQTNIATANSEIERVEGKFDDSITDINNSLEYINTVQKIIYGDSTYYYPCTELWERYTIDTSEIEGNDLSLKFIVYYPNSVLLSNVSGISNGNFQEGFTNWNRSSETDITVMENTTGWLYANDENPIIQLDTNNNTLILTHQHINFTNLDSISFNLRYHSNNPNATGGLFVYIGDDSDTDSLLNTLSDYQATLTQFQGSLTSLNNDLTSVSGDVEDIQSNMYGEGETDSSTGEPYSFENPKPSSYIDTINTTEANLTIAEGRITDSLSRVSSLETGIDTVNGRINNLTGSLDTLDNNLTVLNEDFTETTNAVNVIKNSVYGKEKLIIPLINEWKLYPLDTTSYTTNDILTIEVQHDKEGTVLIKNISYEVADGVTDTGDLIKNKSFQNGLNNWEIDTDEEVTITTTTVNGDRCLSITTNDDNTHITYILQRIGFDKIDSVSFYVKGNPTGIGVVKASVDNGTESDGLFAQISRVQDDITDISDDITDLDDLINNQQNGLRKQITDTNTSVQQANASIDTLIEEIGEDKPNTSSDSVWGKVRQSISDITSIENRLNSAETILGNESQSTGNTIWAKINSLLTRINSAETKLFGKVGGSDTDYTSASIWGRIQNILGRLSTAENNMGTVKADKGGNLQNQIATLLAIQNQSFDCIVVKNVSDLDNMNMCYSSKYAYVLENQKFYEWHYEVTYYDKYGNIVEPEGGDPILIAPDDDIERLGEVMLYGSE